MHKFRLEAVLVFLPRLQLHVRALDHLLEHLDLAVLLLELRLVLRLLLFPELLLPLLEDPLLVCQLLVPADQLPDVLEPLLQLPRQLLVLPRQRSKRLIVRVILHLK